MQLLNQLQELTAFIFSVEAGKYNSSLSCKVTVEVLLDRTGELKPSLVHVFNPHTQEENTGTSNLVYIVCSKPARAM